MKRCPKCKGTNFSVKVMCFQDWNSETDNYSELEVIETMSDEDTYFCRGCDSVFESEDDLEELSDSEVESDDE